MAEVNIENKSKGGGKPAPKKMSTRVDFTPMVDLGFLLITFFMLTTSLIKPQTMEISVPSKQKDSNPPELKESLAVTIMLGKNNVIYYYFGAPKDGVDPEIIKSDFSANGIRKVLLERNYDVVKKIEELKKKFEAHQIPDSVFKKESIETRASQNAPMVIIKATDGANYNNLVDILDEMQICNIGRYAILDITPYELDLLKKNGEPIDEPVKNM